MWIWNSTQRKRHKANGVNAVSEGWYKQIACTKYEIMIFLDDGSLQMSIMLWEHYLAHP